MKRICVVNVAGLSMRLLNRRENLWISSLATAPRAMRPTLPAVPASVQASMTTGRDPGAHGVVAGGVFRRESRELSFAEHSNTLLSKKRFWHARDLPAQPNVALVFWSNPLAGGGDIVLGASTYGCPCAGVSCDPVGLDEEVAGRCGEFDGAAFAGPRASFAVSGWIACAAGEIWKSHKPDLQWVYLPGIDFELVRGGLSAPEVAEAVGALDGFVGRLAETVRADGGQVVVVSDGGYVDVSRAVFPNVRLRDAGLLATIESDEGVSADPANSRAFAMVDHQFAHLYCVDERAADEGADALADLDGIETILPRQEAFCEGLGHDRAGERVMIAEADAWFAHRCRTDRPSPAACGYDPCELLAGGDESRIRASRGRTDTSPEDACVLAATCPLELPGDRGLRVTDLPKVVRGMMFG